MSEELSNKEEFESDFNIENESGKLVPISESIRYRKRAQAAERNVEQLSMELSELKREVVEMEDHLSAAELGRNLTAKLASEGAVDVETAVLVAREKLKGSDKTDIEECVASLKREKGFLFSESGKKEHGGGVKTMAAKNGFEGSGTVVARAAKRAAESGSRIDLQEYLRLRRKYV